MTASHDTFSPHRRPRRTRARHRAVAALAACGLVGAPAVLIGGPAAGAPGDLDASFGSGGVVAGGLLDTFGPVDVDGQNRTVVLGLTEAGGVGVARYTPAGAPDTSFSGDGLAAIALPGEGRELMAVRAMSDGSVVAVGSGLADPADPFTLYTFVARLGPAGAPVGSFGTGGVARRDSVGSFDYPLEASIAPDGTVVISFVVGGAYTGFESVGANGQFVAFEADVTGDAAPQGQGPCILQGFRPVSTAFVSNDRFAHAGDAFYGCGAESFEYPVVSVQSLSSGDAVWSARLPVGETMGDAFRRQPLAFAGGVVVASEAGGQARLRRFAAADGTPDGAFGGGGSLTLPASFGSVGDVAPLAANRIAVVSAGDPFEATPTAVRVVRLSPTGAVDPSFSAATTPVGGPLRRTAAAGAPDGGILVTTQTDSGGALRKYDGGALPAAGALAPLQPGRLLDTRNPGGSTVDGQFAAGGTRPADSELTLQVGGRGGVPADASAVVLNVTVTGAQGAGFVTAWPCDEPRPNASSLNFVEGQTVPNAVVVKLSPAGTVCLYNAQAATDLLADVNGYFPAGSGYEPVQPGRLLDTRNPGGATADGQFAAGGTRPADSELALAVHGRGGVEAGSSAVVLNVTVVAAQGAGFVTVWPCDEPRPNASSLNFVEGQTVPNAVIAKVGPSGTVCLYNAQAATDLLVDVNGYFPAGSGYESVLPARLLDTRAPGGATVDGEAAAGGVRAADAELTLQVAGRGGVPAGASAVALNVTVTGAQGAGFVTAWPCDEPRPNASSLNFVEGQTVPNAVVVKLSPAGTVCLYNAQAATDLLADVNGYFP